MRRRSRTRGLGWAVSVALLAVLLGGVWFGGSDSSASEAAAQFPAVQYLTLSMSNAKVYNAHSVRSPFPNPRSPIPALLVSVWRPSRPPFPW